MKINYRYKVIIFLIKISFFLQYLNSENKTKNLMNTQLEEQRSIVGIHEIYGKIYCELGFEEAQKF